MALQHGVHGDTAQPPIPAAYKCPPVLGASWPGCSPVRQGPHSHSETRDPSSERANTQLTWDRVRVHTYVRGQRSPSPHAVLHGCRVPSYFTAWLKPEATSAV